jgi:hypothetical protein
MAKGSQEEREVSKILSLWWTHNNRDDVIWRTSGSGARATTRTKQGKTTAYQYGDFTFIDPIAKPLFDLFLIEGKRGYSRQVAVLDFVDSLSRNKDPIILRWWMKAEAERIEANRKYAVLILKRDRKNRIIMMENRLFERIAKIEGKFETEYLGNKIKITLDNLIFIIILLDSFITWCKPETIKKMAKPKLIKRK